MNKKKLAAEAFISAPVTFAILMAALQFATSWNYGPFGDEFYYIDCAKHLDFGYVDHPPLVAFVALCGLR